MTTIYFDMDGTLANFYGVKGWLDYLHAENPYPYIHAEPLLRMASLARILNRLQKTGFRIGIISWLARDSKPEYDEAVTKAKMDWLKKHLASVHFDEIHIETYGTPKQTFATENDILFDDEEKNRTTWTGTAYDVHNILEILKGI